MNLQNMTMEELQVLRKEKLKAVAKYNNFQMARKIQLNSLYGALA
jgi:hypothetical protein